MDSQSFYPPIYDFIIQSQDDQDLHSRVSSSGCVSRHNNATCAIRRSLDSRCQQSSTPENINSGTQTEPTTQSKITSPDPCNNCRRGVRGGRKRFARKIRGNVKDLPLESPPPPTREVPNSTINFQGLCKLELRLEAPPSAGTQPATNK